MSDIMPHAVLALGAADIFPIIFVLIGIVSWIINALKDKSQVKDRAARPVRKPQKKRDDSLQSEIDVFIQEVTEQRGGQRQQPKQQRPVASSSRPTSPAPARKRRPLRTQTPPPKPEKRMRPGEEISSRKGPGSRDLGGSLTRHIEERKSSHSIRDETEKRLGHDVDASVTAHFGVSSTAQPLESAVSPSSAIITEVRRMLSNPESVAQAIVLNEILSPPRSKRS